jgi:membrane protease YdiL (CAAX protease family)
MKYISIILKKYDLQFFFFITFITSWSFWLLSGVLSKDWIFKYDHRWIISQIGVFCPAFAAFFISYINNIKQKKYIKMTFILLFIPVIILGIIISFFKVPGILKFNDAIIILIIFIQIWIVFYFLKGYYVLFKNIEIKVNVKLIWLVISILIFPLIFTIIWYISHPPGIEMSINSMEGKWYDIVRAIILIFSINFIYGGSLGEEIGWRGFVLPRLLNKLNPLNASIVLCIFWALYHLPIDITKGFMIPGIAAVLIRMLWTFPLTLIFTWFFIHTKGNVFIIMLLHTSINVLPDLDFTYYENIFPFLYIFMLILGIVFLLKDKMWRKFSNVSLNNNIFCSFR